MKNKTYRFAAVAAVLLAFCLVFTAPVGAVDNESKIGNVEYETLAAAINAASDGQTVTLLNDVTSSEIIEIKTAITLDGDGYTLTSTASRAINVNCSGAVTIKDLIVATNTQIYSESTTPERAINIIEKAVTLTLNNVTAEGFKYTINVAASSEGSFITIIDGKYSGYSTLNICGNDTVVVANDVVFHGNNTAEQSDSNVFSAISIGDYAHSHYSDNVSITINEGRIIATSTNGNKQFIVSAPGVTDSVVVIDSELVILNNAVFNANTVNVAGSFRAEYADELAEDGYVATIAEGNLLSVYATLEEAVAAAESGDTITLLNDVALDQALTVSTSITLNLNGHTISRSNDDAVVVSGASASLTICDNSSEQTGNITSAGSNYNRGAIWINDGATVTLKSGKLAGTGYAVCVGSGSSRTAGMFVMDGGELESGYIGINIPNGTVTIKDGKISAVRYGISGHGNHDGTTITITGGTIVATDPEVDGNKRVATAIYHPQGGTLTITGGEIMGPNGIQFVGDGQLTITGGTITGTHEAQVPYPLVNFNGGMANGAALSIVKASGYGSGPLLASITGGTFTSDANDAIRIYGNDTAGGNGVEGVTLLDPVKFIKGGIFSTAPDVKYLVDNYEAVKQNDGTYKVQEKKPVTTTTTTTTTTSKPKEEPPVEEPVTPTEPVAGEVTVETTVTNGGELTFETPAEPETPVEGESGEQGEAPTDAPAEPAVTGVVLPEGTNSEVSFIPVSEQPAPAGKETQTKKVFEINVPTYEKGKPATIKFTMTVAELEADGKTAEQVALWHFDEETGEWTKLVTSYTIVDGVVYFEAITNDFSPFAIIYEEAPVDEPVEEPETPASPAPLFAVLAGLGAAVVLRRK